MFALAVGFVLVLAVPALASFPGQNGKLAVSGCTGDSCGVVTMNPDGGDRIQITHNPFKHRVCTGIGGCFEVSGTDDAPHWSPDGLSLLFAREGDIYRVGADGGGLTQLTAPPDSDSQPAWSPDGHKIAFTRDPGGRGRSVDLRLFVMNSDGTGATQLAEHGDSPDWSPDGSTIAYVVPHQVAGSAFYIYYRDIHLIDPDGTNDRAITASAEPSLFGYDDPSWSPDGRRLAVTGARLQSAACCRHDNDIWVMNADGSGLTNLTPDTPGEDNGHPVFAPDGTKLAAHSGGLAVMNPDGSDVLLLNDGGRQPDWQPISPGPRRSDYNNAAKFCKAERAFLGNSAFGQKYSGAANAHGKCVSDR